MLRQEDGLCISECFQKNVKTKKSGAIVLDSDSTKDDDNHGESVLRFSYSSDLK